MSKRKGLSLEEKRKRMLEMFYEKKEVFQLKEVEKIASKEKGITSMAVKDVLQSLVDDNLVDSDRIGTSNYYWAFPSKASQAEDHSYIQLCCEAMRPEEFVPIVPFTNRTQQRSFIKRTLEDVTNKLQESEQREKKMKMAVEKASVGRETSDKRAEILQKVSEKERLAARLQGELDLYKEVDPEVLEQIKTETKVAQEAANRWTDNVFAIKSWCKKKFGMEEKILDKQFGISEDFDYID